MSLTPVPTDESLSDLFELGEAIDALILAATGGDREQIQAAYDEAMQSVSCVAVLHCDIVTKTIADHQRSWARMGLRVVAVPINYEGLWVVTPPKEKL